MSRVTKFAGRDPAPSTRLLGFMAHLRENGLRVGVGETALVADGLRCIDQFGIDQTRQVLRPICAGSQEQAKLFDQLFDAFWLDSGRVRQKLTPSSKSNSGHDTVHSSRDAKGAAGSGTGSATAPDGEDGAAEADGEGKLIATLTRNSLHKDLRDLVRPEDIARAEQVAYRLGAALRDRRSRRRKAARKGRDLHFRKTIRRSLSAGGEPLSLYKKHRPDRSRNIVALCDVSGSMTIYAQVYLAFVAGIMRADMQSDAYLFHTRLVRISDALRDKDAMRSIGKLSLIANGFGGGSKIGACLQRFADTYAKNFVNGRSVVMILSDGYDTAEPEATGAALRKLKKRGCRIVWLNPLKGWKDYAPVAGGMAAAFPYLDHFAAASTLADLAQLEQELSNL